MRRFLLCLPLASLLTACPGPPQKPRDTPALPEDEWSKAPKTAEWLYATRDVGGSHEHECKEVTKWIDGEAKCSGGLCAHGRDLAKDWLSRCTKDDAEETDDVREHLADYKRKAQGELTSCGEQAEKWLREGCHDDCANAAATWATQCGATDGSPLVLRMLERAVERQTGARATLDPRGCDAILQTVAEGAKCAQQFKCETASKDVATYRTRCEADDHPLSLLAAVFSLAIDKGALLPTKPVTVAKAGGVSSRDIGTALDDGTGAAISVCGERVFDLSTYVAKRKSCENGAVTFVKAFKQDGAATARLGEVPHVSDAAFARSFPSLMLDGEAELRDAQAFAAFQAGLTAAASDGDATSSLAKVAATIADNAARIRRASAYKEELTHQDAALSRAFAALGAAKVKVARGRVTPAELSGLVARASTRPFADTNAQGKTELGAASAASILELADVLPTSFAAYTKALAPALSQAKLRKPDAKSQSKARGAAKAQAEACGAAEKTLSDAEQTLIACVFGLASCDDAKIASLAKTIDDQRDAAEAARRKLDFCATSAGPSSQDELTQAVATAGCLEPWW